MPWFHILVKGENYMLRFEDQVPSLMGFYVNKWVEAATRPAAEAMVFDMIRNDDYLSELIADEGASRPQIMLAEINLLNKRPTDVKVELGEEPSDVYWHFFPME